MNHVHYEEIRAKEDESKRDTIVQALPLTGAVELMDEVLDSQENEGLRPLKLKRCLRKDRLLLLLPMLIRESEMADERAAVSDNSPNILANSAVPMPDVAAAALLVVVAVKVLILSSGVIGGSDMVPIHNNIDEMN